MGRRRTIRSICEPVVAALGRGGSTAGLDTASVLRWSRRLAGIDVVAGTIAIVASEGEMVGESDLRPSTERSQSAAPVLDVDPGSAGLGPGAAGCEAELGHGPRSDRPRDGRAMNGRDRDHGDGQFGLDVVGQEVDVVRRGVGLRRWLGRAWASGRAVRRRRSAGVTGRGGDR